MKHILTILCILVLAPAAFAGGTMLFTTPQNESGPNNWYYPNGFNKGYTNTNSAASNFSGTQYTQNSNGNMVFTQNGVQKPGQTYTTKETSYEKHFSAGHESTYRTKQDKYYNHGGVKFGTGFSNNGTTGRW